MMQSGTVFVIFPQLSCTRHCWQLYYSSLRLGSHMEVSCFSRSCLKTDVQRWSMRYGGSFNEVWYSNLTDPQWFKMGVLHGKCITTCANRDDHVWMSKTINSKSVSFSMNKMRGNYKTVIHYKFEIYHMWTLLKFFDQKNKNKTPLKFEISLTLLELLLRVCELDNILQPWAVLQCCGRKSNGRNSTCRANLDQDRHPATFCFGRYIQISLDLK